MLSIGSILMVFEKSNPLSCQVWLLGLRSPVNKAAEQGDVQSFWRWIWYGKLCAKQAFLW